MIIKNIRLIDPATDRDEKVDIYICEGRIDKIVQAQTSDASVGVTETVIEGEGLIAAPGLVDVHVHFRDPGFEYKEDIYSGARAAAAGGFTSVVCMANTKPAIDNPQTLEYVINKGKETDINVYTCADITMELKGSCVVDMETLKKSGAAGFTDDGIPIRDPEIVKAAMRCAAEVDMPLSFHEEDPQYISENGINAGKASEYFGIKGSPRIAEISLIERDIEIAQSLIDEAGGNVSACPHIVVQHISSEEGVELVRKAREKNPRIHAEACPHHFSLTEEAVIKHGALAKMNPPLRTEKDRQAIIRGLSDGTIEIISTDHAPHSEEEKKKPITQAPSGIIGLETSLGLGIKNLVNPGHLTLMSLIEKMSTNPARLYNLNAGSVYEGGPADLVIFNPEEEWKVPETFNSKSTNTPFAGEILPGKIYMTICAGRVVFTQPDSDMRG